ncbi:type IV secretion system protein VirD4 [Malonomonas rubra DSM 5091]|uniref:Type IV secretion system protein VirD4 n=1 Tax=Malonomonas rubra DSM 5091 TaxID=1122189 RepID=A0A1M6KTE3_MALRU|nr:type IV secretory system conjugative DNA transfer family protein [Malonomonas rubra]SHJ62134.1 type IV secretion system protein VirD4 [Malonomonas rubra DSM 5091]
MTLSLNDNSWLKPLLFVVVTLVCAVLWVYLTGGFFLAVTGGEFKDADLMTAYSYWYHYAQDEKIRSWLSLSAIFSALVAALPLALLIIPKRRSLYGEARFATESEIRKAKLKAEKGIIVGKNKGRYLIFGGEEHVLMAAPTRSGKGVGMAIPNLLNWADSVVALDTKQELWDITSGFRSKHGQDCFLFNPEARDYRSHRWNPLHYISDNPHFRITDIQAIANMIFPENDREAPIWQASARSFFLGIVLYLLETEGLPVSLGEVLRQATSGDDLHFSTIITERNEQGQPLSGECVAALSDYLNTSDSTRSSIRKTFTSSLELWFNPIIDAATSENDFDLRDLRKKRQTIYLGVAPGALDRLGPLLNLFFQQTIELNTRQLPEQNPELKHQVLLLMDEFAALGRINILMRGLSFIAGYGLRLLPIIQSPAQIREIYGVDAAESFMDNHALRVIFAPKGNKDAKDISETLGDTTVKGRTRSRNFGGRDSKSISESDQRRALLLPQELRGLGQDNQIIIAENCPPILCRKIRYYKEKTFTHRLLNPPDIGKLEIRKRDFPGFSMLGNSPEPMTVERAIKAEDIAEIDQLDIEDFSCDFSSVEVPTGEISDQQMTKIVDRFFNEIEASV